MKPMLGKPMLYYTIRYAKSCDLIDDIYVSTDAQSIAEYALSQKVKVVMRPAELCGDAIIVDVLRHCVRHIPHQDKISRVVALQVDHPDRELNLTHLVKTAVDQDIADLITIEPHGILSGSVRILRKTDLMEERISQKIFAAVDHSTNIHTQNDFNKADQRLKKIYRESDLRDMET